MAKCRSRYHHLNHRDGEIARRHNEMKAELRRLWCNKTFCKNARKNKVSFSSRQDAQLALKLVKRISKAQQELGICQNRRAPYRAYECPTCTYHGKPVWHLSSHKRKEVDDAETQ